MHMVYDLSLVPAVAWSSCCLQRRPTNEPCFWSSYWLHYEWAHVNTESNLAFDQRAPAHSPPPPPSLLIERPPPPPPPTKKTRWGKTAQFIECWTEKPGTTLMPVWFPSAARDFSPIVNFKCKLSEGVGTDPHSNLMHQRLFTHKIKNVGQRKSDHCLGTWNTAHIQRYEQRCPCGSCSLTQVRTAQFPEGGI